MLCQTRDVTSDMGCHVTNRKPCLEVFDSLNPIETQFAENCLILGQNPGFIQVKSWDISRDRRTGYDRSRERRRRYDRKRSWSKKQKKENGRTIRARAPSCGTFSSRASFWFSLWRRLSGRRCGRCHSERCRLRACSLCAPVDGKKASVSWKPPTANVLTR